MTSACLLPAAEAGIPGFEYATCSGMLAPAGTPRAVLARIRDDTVAVLRAPAVLERFAKQGLDPRPTIREEFAGYVGSELRKWSRVVRTAGLKVQ